MKRYIFAGLMLASPFTHADNLFGKAELTPVTLVNSELRTFSNGKQYVICYYKDSKGSTRNKINKLYLDIFPADKPCLQRHSLPTGLVIGGILFED